jgi:hypothetical protein
MDIHSGRLCLIDRKRFTELRNPMLFWRCERKQRGALCFGNWIQQ